MIRLVLQILGLFVLMLGLTIVTLRWQNADADGPSTLFPGGKLVSGELYTGPEPDWRFTDDLYTIELQLVEPLASRLVFVMESGGKLYVPSGYMTSFLGRIWKDWAFQADAGDGLAVIRIEDIRYERRLVRVTGPSVISGVAAKLAQKYRPGGVTPEAIAQIEKSVAGAALGFLKWPRENQVRMREGRE